MESEFGFVVTDPPGQRLVFFKNRKEFVLSPCRRDRSPENRRTITVSVGLDSPHPPPFSLSPLTSCPLSLSLCWAFLLHPLPWAARTGPPMPPLALSCGPSTTIASTDGTRRSSQKGSGRRRNASPSGRSTGPA